MKKNEKNEKEKERKEEKKNSNQFADRIRVDSFETKKPRVYNYNQTSYRIDDVVRTFLSWKQRKTEVKLTNTKV